MAFIYLITNQINGKQYVGKTTHDSIQKRFQEHIRDSKRSRCEKRPFYDAMNKYGVENFSIEQLEECSAENSSEREMYWIEKLDTYKNGYNATLGGDSKHYYDYQEIANKYLELQRQDETAKFFDCDVQTVRIACQQCGVRIRTRSEVQSKSVAMLDKDSLEILRVFESITEAALFLGNKRKGAHIGKVCNGVRKIAYGYKWKYIDGD